jgi:hypothetical protein
MDLPVYTYCGQDPLSEHIKVKIDLSGPVILLSYIMFY